MVELPRIALGHLHCECSVILLDHNPNRLHIVAFNATLRKRNRQAHNLRLSRTLNPLCPRHTAILEQAMVDTWGYRAPILT